MAAVDIQNVVKHYGDVVALEKVSLSIRDNEFFTLLGPSGCGKTTLLRTIAGFETVTAGQVLLFGQSIEGLPPNKRPINTVFQQYALFPHMTVAENVAFGLQRLKRPKSEVETRVWETLDLVQLGDFKNRRPAQLSGGQQQRVALARALAPRPKVLLLDEPLSALDLKLRQAMREELKGLQQETGITFIFVTHDQEEALTMSDRIAVMSKGKVQQIGSSQDIYERPQNRFVADFIGETNLLDVTIESADGAAVVCKTSGGTTLTAQSVEGLQSRGSAYVSIRPEQISLVPPKDPMLMEGIVDRVIYLGTDNQYLVALPDGTEIRVRAQVTPGNKTDFGPGDRVGLDVRAGAARLLVD